MPNPSFNKTTNGCNGSAKLDETTASAPEIKATPGSPGRACQDFERRNGDKSTYQGRLNGEVGVHEVSNSEAREEKADSGSADAAIEPSEGDEKPQKSEQHIDQLPPATAATEATMIPVSNITSPRQLISHMFKIEGRGRNTPVGIHWNEIHCYRDKQYIGSLLDAKQALLAKQK